MDSGYHQLSDLKYFQGLVGGWNYVALLSTGFHHDIEFQAKICITYPKKGKSLTTLSYLKLDEYGSKQVFTFWLLQ